jgi:iron(III) transport system substrate-binding protein
MRLSRPLFAGLALSALFAGQAAAADKLTLYCSAQEDWCQVMARGFEEATSMST